MCQCPSVLRPTPTITVQMHAFNEYLHLEFSQNNSNVYLLVSYDLNPSKHFPGAWNKSMTLKSDKLMQVGHRQSSFKCNADEKLELDFYLYHMEVTINHVQFQAYDIANGTFSPGKRKLFDYIFVFQQVLFCLIIHFCGNAVAQHLRLTAFSHALDINKSCLKS